MSDLPAPPPGFRLVPTSSAIPPPPPGFSLVAVAPQEPQPTTAEAVNDAIDQAPRGINRGINSILALPGELVGGAINMVAPGQGDRFKWNNPVSEFLTSPDAQPQTELGRYANSVGQAVGSSAIPMAGIAAKATQAAPAIIRPATNWLQTAGQNVAAAGRNIVDAYRVAPGAAVAADVAASTGSGVGQQMAQEGGFGPTGQMIGGLAGSLTPAGIAGVAGGSVRGIQRARANQGEAGAYGQIADGLPGGVSSLADNIAAGGSRRANAAQNRETLDILGQEMERAGGDVQQAQQATLDRLMREQGLDILAARARIRQLTAVHEDSPLFLGEYPAVSESDAAFRQRQPGPVNLDELGRIEDSVTQNKLDYLGNNGNTQSAQNVRNALARREEDLSPALANNLTRSGPQVPLAPTHTRPANITDVEQMVAQADNLARQEYRAAHQGQINTGLMQNALPRLLAWHERRAGGRAGEPATSINRALGQFYLDTPNGPMPMQSLQQLQDARGAVRGQLTEYRRAGRDDLVNAVQPIYSQVTRLMEQMSPQWAQANRRWADGRLQEVAAELGDAFSKTAGPRFREQMREFDRMAPEAQSVVRVHWIQQQLDRLANAPDSASVSKYFTNDHLRGMVRQLLGDEAAASFVRTVRDVKTAERSQNMMRNSATHRRGQAQKQMDAETGLVAAVENASVKGARTWLLERLEQALKENKNRPLARILTTRMSDTPQVAMHLNRMQQQADQLARITQPQSRSPAAAGRLAPMLNPMMEE